MLGSILGPLILLGILAIPSQDFMVTGSLRDGDPEGTGGT